MNYGLSKAVIDQIKSVFRQFPELEKVILYGSRAKGTYKTGSDIDLTFIGEGLNLQTLNKISNELDDLLLPYTFDLSNFKDISNKDLVEHIQRVGVTFYSADSVNISYKS